MIDERECLEREMGCADCRRITWHYRYSRGAIGRWCCGGRGWY